MRLAVIADIHSNLPALEAVLTDIAARGVDEIIVAGDSINGGPFPSEVVGRLQAGGWAILLGNHEQYVLNYLDANGDYGSALWGSVRWTAAQMHAEQLRDVRGWPTATEREDILIVHGSPDDLSGGIQPGAPAELIAARFGQVTQPWVVTAHTHKPFVRQWQHLTLINPGSVGMPLDHHSAACYAILTRRTEGLVVEHHRVHYDTRLVTEATQDRGLLDAGGPIARLHLEETLTGRPLVRAYLARLHTAIEEAGWTEAEAMARVPLLS